MSLGHVYVYISKMNLNPLAFIDPEISTFIRTDGQTDSHRRTCLERLGYWLFTKIPLVWNSWSLDNDDDDNKKGNDCRWRRLRISEVAISQRRRLTRGATLRQRSAERRWLRSYCRRMKEISCAFCPCGYTATNIRRRYIISSGIEQMWTGLDKCDREWANVNGFGQMWPGFSKCEQDRWHKTKVVCAKQTKKYSWIFFYYNGVF